MLSKLNNIERLSERVIRILGCNSGPMTLQGTNTYLVGTGKSRLLIDTGDAQIPEYTEYLRECLKTCYDWPISIQALILTHWHHDHVGGIMDVLDDVVGSKNIPLYKYPQSPNEKPPGNGDLKYTFVSDKQVISTEGATLEVLFTPGHSTDHISLKLVEEDAIFCADCVLGEGTAVFEDLYDYMKSLQLLLDAKPKLMYPGHGKVIEDPIGHVSHYIQHREEREGQIVECLKVSSTSLTSMEIAKRIYLDLPENLYMAAAKNVLNHLQKLCKESKVECLNDKWKISSKL